MNRPHATADQDYMFERPLKEKHSDGSESDRRVDCYKRGHFILEARKVNLGSHTKSYSNTLLGAHAQAQNYARALPAAEGRPPIILVVDVGQVIQLFAEFSRTGGNYIPYPDPRSHQIKLQDLRDEKIRQRLRLVWTDPMALDPCRANAKVTREVANVLASVAKSLEADGQPPHQVGAFLTRCLFSMFAEDVGLLPASEKAEGKHDSKGALTELLQTHRHHPPTLQRMLQALWSDMDRGGFSAALAREVRKFNGKLFKASQSEGYALPLSAGQIDGLLTAAEANWTEVEPAIFGTLLERALDPDERHALGAHFTPRAYVDRLVIPTVIDPLRAEWSDTQACHPRPDGRARRPDRRGRPTHRRAGPKTKKTSAKTKPKPKPSWMPSTNCAPTPVPKSAKPSRPSKPFTTACAPCSCWTQPAAAAIFCT